MKLQLTPAVLREVSVLRASGYKGAGFLLGSAIGRFVIIDQLLPLDFTRVMATPFTVPFLPATASGCKVSFFAGAGLLSRIGSSRTWSW